MSLTNNSGTRWGQDDVSGVIIGGVCLALKGKVFYDGRLQGRDVFASTELELIKLAKHQIRKLKNETSEVLSYLYNDSSKWEFWIYNS